MANQYSRFRGEIFNLRDGEGAVAQINACSLATQEGLACYFSEFKKRLNAKKNSKTSLAQQKDRDRANV